MMPGLMVRDGAKAPPHHEGREPKTKGPGSMMPPGTVGVEKTYSSALVAQYSRTWLSARCVSLTFFDTPQASDCWCSGM
jgi:hypothetical protein